MYYKCKTTASLLSIIKEIPLDNFTLSEDEDQQHWPTTLAHTCKEIIRDNITFSKYEISAVLPDKPWSTTVIVKRVKCFYEIISGL